MVVYAGLIMPTAESLSRVVVVGTSCAGKSTFAQAFASTCDCPRIELDELYWGMNWQPKPLEEFRHLVAQAANAEAWVADGNYRVVRELLWSRAQTIIWLNYSYPRVLWRAFKRTIRRSLTREQLWHGNRESVWQSFFTKKSILVWVATTHYRRKREFAELRAARTFEHLSWIEFKHPEQAARWLAAEFSHSLTCDAGQAIPPLG